MSPRPRPRPRPRNSYIGTPQLPFPFRECKDAMQKSSSSTFLHSTIKPACFASKCLTYIHIQQVRVPCLCFSFLSVSLGISIPVLPTLPYLPRARLGFRSIPVSPRGFRLPQYRLFFSYFLIFLFFIFFLSLFFLVGGSECQSR